MPSHKTCRCRLDQNAGSAASAEAVFGANADFFIRRVVPEITRVSLTIGTLIPGQTPLPGSSDPATATPTS